MDDNKGLDEFLEFLKPNAVVQQELKALEGQPYDAYYAGFVAVGARHGYTYTADEVEEMTDDVLADQAFGSGELTDAQLETVAGGKGGGGGAVKGILEAIVKNVFGND